MLASSSSSPAERVGRDAAGGRWRPATQDAVVAGEGAGERPPGAPRAGAALAGGTGALVGRAAVRQHAAAVVRAAVEPPVDVGGGVAGAQRDEAELVADLPERLGVAEEQVAAVAQAGVQPRHQRPGGLAAEVDGHVAAQHEVEPVAGVEGRRVGDQVVVRGS